MTSRRKQLSIERTFRANLAIRTRLIDRLWTCDRGNDSEFEAIRRAIRAAESIAK